MTLAAEPCEVCRTGAPPVDDAQLALLLPQIPDWDLVTEDGVRKLRRTFRVRDFAAALALTNAVGALAEAAGHHPALLTEWGRVTVTWWTHKIHDLHRNDFVMAARTDGVWEAERGVAAAATS